ncbi:uncharacterized protein LOC115630797 [Scaptodrosophila lebanonensis]|uniref:Uncharacterized protein LOC115630797 n=1 Tax=Drosophila lebanonensis TaxID=7225 RepID=A0A6J2U4N4_DROLE|nr:uncharacterized protein LOC115630797 [Scaptodrosophila lebanonensis]
MEKNTSSLLPYILDLLSRQPDLCTTVDNLVDQIKDIVLNEHVSPFGTLKRAVEFALEVGMNLGILSLSDQRVRVPFNFRSKKAKTCMQSNHVKRIPPEIGKKTIRRLELANKPSQNRVPSKRSSRTSVRQAATKRIRPTKLKRPAKRRPEVRRLNRKRLKRPRATLGALKHGKKTKTAAKRFTRKVATKRARGSARRAMIRAAAIRRRARAGKPRPRRMMRGPLRRNTVKRGVSGILRDRLARLRLRKLRK